MTFGDIVAGIIGGAFGVVFLGALAVMVVAYTAKYCMPIYREIYQEYTKWKTERAKEDAEFLEIYGIYKRINKKDTDNKTT